MDRFGSILLLLALSTATSALAQAPVPLETGTRIRLWLRAQPPEIEGAAPQQLLRGTLAAVSADSLTLHIHAGVAPFSIAWDAVSRLDESRGVPSPAQSASRSGALWALYGASQFMVLENRAKDPLLDASWYSALAGAGVGVLVAALTGELRPRERWRRIRLLER